MGTLGTQSGPLLEVINFVKRFMLFWTVLYHVSLNNEHTWDPACIAKVVFFWRLLKRKLCEEVYPLLDRSFSEEVPLVEPPKMGTLGTHGACIRLSSFGGYFRVLLDCLCEEVYPRSDSSSNRIIVLPSSFSEWI